MSALLIAFVLFPQDPRRDLDEAVRGFDVPAAVSAAQSVARRGDKPAVDILVGAMIASRSEELRLKQPLASAEARERAAHLGYTRSDDRNREALRAAWQETLKAVHQTAAKIDIQSRIRIAIEELLPTLSGDSAAQGIFEQLRVARDPQVRAALASAVAAFDRDDAARVLSDTLKRERDPVVRVALIEALTKWNRTNPSLTDAVLSALKSADAFQCHSAILAYIRKLRLLEAADAVLLAFEKAPDGRMVYEFQTTMAELTGVDKGISASAWRSWWTAHRDAVLAGRYAPSPDEVASKKGAMTRFFGIPIQSNRVVFVFDKSESMLDRCDFEIPDDGGGAIPPELQKPAGKSKLDVARWHLKRAIHQLPDGALFNIVMFDDGVETFRDRLTKVSRHTRQEAFAFIDAAQPRGSTNIFDSLERALSFAGADTVCLLTDGMPNRGRYAWVNDIRREIQRLNRHLKVALHAVLIWSELTKPEPKIKDRPVTEIVVEFMQALAKENGGECRIYRASAR